MSTRIYVAGGDSFIGRAIRGRVPFSTEPREKGTRPLLVDDPEPDLTDRAAVERFFAQTRPDVVLVAAGKTAGIAGNQRSPADLMLDNLLGSTHVISAACNAG